MRGKPPKGSADNISHHRYPSLCKQLIDNICGDKFSQTNTIPSFRALQICFLCSGPYSSSRQHQLSAGQWIPPCLHPSQEPKTCSSVWVWFLEVPLVLQMQSGGTAAQDFVPSRFGCGEAPQGRAEPAERAGQRRRRNGCTTLFPRSEPSVRG